MLVAQSCPTLCNHMDYSLPGSSVHGIVPARILEWVAILLSRGSAQPGMEPGSPLRKQFEPNTIVKRVLTHFFSFSRNDQLTTFH